MMTKDRSDWDFGRIEEVTRLAVRILNRVIDTSKYPFPEQEAEMRSKRRMGVGIMGLANAVEAMGCAYGSPEFISRTGRVMFWINQIAYDESVNMAVEDGPFPLFDQRYLKSQFIDCAVPVSIVERIAKHGIRNSHLTSIAPTGSISLLCGNISSGIEPTFAKKIERKILLNGSTEPETHILTDYGVKHFGNNPLVTNDVPLHRHLLVAAAAQKWVDSAVSKTINCAEHTRRDTFDKIYMDAWKSGMKGVTVFRDNCKRVGIMKAVEPTSEADNENGPMCEIDENGRVLCG